MFPSSAGWVVEMVQRSARHCRRRYRRDEQQGRPLRRRAAGDRPAQDGNRPPRRPALSPCRRAAHRRIRHRRDRRTRSGPAGRRDRRQRLRLDARLRRRQGRAGDAGDGLSRRTAGGDRRSLREDRAALRRDVLQHLARRAVARPAALLARDRLSRGVRPGAVDHDLEPVSRLPSRRPADLRDHALWARSRSFSTC